MKKRNKTILLLIIVLILACVGVTYSLMVWRTPSNTDTQISFSSNGLDEYINYSEGESITAEDAAVLGKSPTFLGGANTTIELWKKPIASSLSLYGHIYMDITSISADLTSNTGLKWSVVSDSRILNEGYFYGSTANDTIDLASNIILRDTIQTFTVYIWLDAAVTDATDLIGDSISTVIRCSVTDEPDHNFVINSVSNPNPSVILVDASSNSYYISEYAFEEAPAEGTTETSNNKKVRAKFMVDNGTFGLTIPDPQSWTVLEEPTRNFLKKFYFTDVGTYYIWVKTTNSDIRFQTISVSSLDVTAPEITLANALEITSASSNTQVVVPIKITDQGSGIDTSSFTVNDVIVKVGGVTVTPTTKRLVFSSEDNGEYIYNLTISGIDADGALTLEIPASTITDNVNNTTGLTTINTGVTIKTQGPQNSSVLINNDAEFTNTDSVTLSIASTGAESICVSNTITCTSYIPYRTSYNWTLEASNGEKIVYVSFKDDAGNVSRVSDTIILDNTPPRIDLNGSPSDSYINSNQSVTIPIKITDSGSGITSSDFTSDDITVKLNGASINASKSLSFQSVTKGIYIYNLLISSVSGSGNISIEIPGYTVTDNAGNANALTQLDTGVVLDNTPPTVTAISASSSGRNVTINMTGSDSSGIASYWYSINGTTYYSSSNNNYIISGVENGTFTVYGYVKDSADNVSAVSTTTVTVAAVNLDSSTANEPVLVDGMIPVYYDSSSSNWKKADSHNADANYQWYSYANRNWANAVLVDSTNRGTYMNAAAGTAIDSNHILGYFVWIPRYKYKVWNINKATGTDSYSARTTGIDIVFEKGIEKTGTITCSIGSSTKTETCSGSNGEYYTHPAFTLGSEELKGFWISKFEVSYNSNQAKAIPSNSIESSASETYQTIASNASTFSSSIYMTAAGASSSDSHLTKNMEWGATAYLSNSIYGLCPNNACTDIGLNNIVNSSTYTTGCGATSGSSSSISCSDYSTTNGTKASTTGNIYGVYDLSGGLPDAVMGTSYASGNTAIAYASSGFTSSTLTTSSKYVNLYAYGTSSTDYTRGLLGDATSEVVSSSGYAWYSDTASAPNITTTLFIFTTYSNWMSRGGSAATSGSSCGMFTFENNTGSTYPIGYHSVIKP